MGTRWLRWVNLVTVEPVMFFYMFAFMLTSVVEQSFFVYKACRADMGYSSEICLHLNKQNYTEEKEKVQRIVANFHQYNNVASYAIPIVLALMLGSWSDRRGRKLPLIIGLIGKLYYVLLIIVNATQDTWILNVVILSASLPSAFTGADVAIFMACFSYLADVTPPEDKTLRYGILNNVQLATMPTGIALGKYLFNLTNQSYVIMFSINACLLITAIVFALLRLQWQTNEKQSSILYVDNCFTDFFDKDRLVDSAKAIVRKRPGNRRTYLNILFMCMLFYTFQRDEMAMTYLYTLLKFKWTDDNFSDYRTFQSAAYVIGTLVGVPVMTKYLGLRDTVIVMVGAVCHSAARVVFAFAEVSWLFYVGGAVVSFGPVAAPVIRSMTSKVVPVSERGVVFAVLSAADMAVRLLSGVIYTQVYDATISTFPAAIFWVTVASQVIVFLLVLYIHISLGKNSLDVDENEPVNQEPDKTELNVDKCENVEDTQLQPLAKDADASDKRAIETTELKPLEECKNKNGNTETVQFINSAECTNGKAKIGT